MKKMAQRINNWLKILFEEQKHDNQKSTIAVLDGVRALAIIFVISFHISHMMGDGSALWPWQSAPLASAILTAGGTGVTLFFVLSGFLLFMPYAKALLFDTRKPLARTFYVRRAFRIVPGYYFSLIILVLLVAPQYLNPDHLFHLGLFVTFLMDSSKETFRDINGPYWTLAVECQFYMIMPLLMLAFFFLVKRVPLVYRLRAVTFCLLGVIVWGLFIRYWGLYFLQNPGATIPLVPHRLLNAVLFFIFGQTGKYIEDFAVGMLASLCYIYAQSLPQEHRFVQTLKRLSPWLWGVGLLILVFSAMWHLQSGGIEAWHFLDRIMPYFSWLSEMVLAWGYAMCIMAILFGPPVLQRPFSWMPLRWIGLISYSVYIWHLPLLALFQTHILNHYWPGMNHYLMYTLLWGWAAVVVIPFCVLCYAFVERPGIKLGDRFRKRIEQRYRAKLQPPPIGQNEPERVAVSGSKL